MTMNPGRVFETDRYLARRKVFHVFGGAFTIHDPESRDVIAWCKQRAFKLKEDIRVYADPSAGEEILLIKARQIVDFSAAYDVTDPASGESVGMLRRRGFASMFRDRWQIFDPDGTERGEIREDSQFMAFVRRFLTNIIPQKFHVLFDGRQVGSLRQLFNPFVLKVDVDFSADREGAFDRRLGLAAVILLLAIEGRQR